MKGKDQTTRPQRAGETPKDFGPRARSDIRPEPRGRRTPRAEAANRAKAGGGRVRQGFLLGLLLLLTASCAHLSPDLPPENVAPFFHIQTDPEKGSRRLDAWGPFYSQVASPTEEEWTLRPLFSYRRHPETGTEELEFLYPLGSYKKTPQGTRCRFIPFYFSFEPSPETRKEDAAEQEDLFPFFWGKGRDGTPYGGVFPFGGVFRDRFGRDEIGFFLWPLHTWVREGDNQTVHYLWPVFSFTSGGTRSGFRFWPFFGQENQCGEGAYEKVFFLWPIGHYQRRYLDTDDPKTYFYLFPFYLSEKSAHEEKLILLWPFLNFYREERFHYRQVDLPWPIVQWARGERTEAFKLWPLLSYRRTDNREKWSLFWPLFAQEKEENEERDEVLNRFLYVCKIHQVYFKREDRWERVTRLWPLFRHAEDGRGLVHFFFPALMPADWEGLERHYGTLFRVFEYYCDGKGKEITKFLWGLVYHQKQPDRIRFDIGPLFSYHREKIDWNWSVLKGLLAYGRNGSKRTLRLFFFPVTWEEGSEAAPGPASLPGG